MEAYIPIAVYKLPREKHWLAQALGIESPLVDGRTQAAAKKNLAVVMGHYLDMLKPDDPLDAIEMEWLDMLSAPPQGVDWILVDLSPEAKAAREKRRVPVSTMRQKKPAKLARARNGKHVRVTARSSSSTR